MDRHEKPGLRQLLFRIHLRISKILLRRMDSRRDRRICGQSLVKYVPSVYRNDAEGLGGTGSHSTNYVVLKRIFSHVVLTAQDVFLDVGCGKGRTLAFLVDEKAPCKLWGIEINEISGRIAQAWTQKYKQAEVLLGDAFQLDYNAYTVLYLYRPFLPKTFLRFVEKLEADLTHPIRLIYWADQESGFLLKNRPGWRLQFRERLKTVWGLRIERSPQSYSLWEYDPEQRRAQGAERAQ